jgi:hypothetical protein
VATRGKQTWSDFAKSAGSGSVDLPGMFTAQLVDAVVRCLDLGAFVSFGMSRDGGALGCTLIVDGEPVRKWWHSPDEGLVDWLELAADTIGAN